VDWVTGRQWRWERAREGGCPEWHFAGGGISGAKIWNFGVRIAMC